MNWRNFSSRPTPSGGFCSRSKEADSCQHSALEAARVPISLTSRCLKFCNTCAPMVIGTNIVTVAAKILCACTRSKLYGIPPQGADGRRHRSLRHAR